jgi:hypothetical protein
MTATTQTLTDFLSDRIAEDEVQARAAVVPLAFEPLKAWLLLAGDPSNMPGAVLAEPSRVLAECAAKRRIVERWQHADRESLDQGPRRTYGWQAAVLYEALKDLAAIYADHPDYREEWKP